MRTFESVLAGPANLLKSQGVLLGESCNRQTCVAELLQLEYIEH